MHKWKSISIFCLSGIVIIAAGTGIAATLALPHLPPIMIAEQKPFEWTNETLASTAVLSEEQIQEDTEQLVQMVEETHPMFLKQPPEVYLKAKAALIEATDKPMRVEDYQIQLNRYMSSLQDGHTQVYWIENEWLEIEWQYEDGRLYLLDEKGKLTHKTVTSIMDSPVESLTHAADQLFSAENQPAKALNYEKYLRSKRFLKYQGITANKAVTVTIEDQGQKVSQVVNFGENERMNRCKRLITGEALDQKTYYIKLETCEVNAQLEKMIQSLKDALAKGTNRVIIDVRDNHGGSSSACSLLMEAMNMKPGEFGSVVRYSPMACREYGILQKKGRYVYSASNRAVGNPNIDLYVITNKETFSSAQWLATWVKDGKLGKIVGQPSSNKPSSYGDVLNFQLPNSKLIGGISFKQWLRPDKSRNDEAILEPDIYVATGTDPISVIMGL